MKNKLALSGRFALSGIAAAAILASVPNAYALGLGRLQVQSSLGELLRAEIDVTSLSADESSNLRIRVAPPEAYRAAGIEYNPVLPATQVTVERRADGRPYLRLRSDRAVQEPFVDVILEISWATGRLVREYTLLFDPPTMARATPAPAVPPAMAAAPPAAPLAQAPAPAPMAAPVRAPRASRPAVAEAPAPERPTGPDEYQVRSGDTLSKIARQTQRGGVSLDQMLVALFRANPQAFVDNNMNRLRSGVVLAVPNSDDARSVVPGEARQMIQAQAADFNAYRARLAGVAPAAAPEASGRQAAGKVQASVDDRKQAAAPAPDKLTLSKGVATAKAVDEASKAAAEKDAATRVAELSKNVDELKKLQGAAASAPKVGAAVPAAAAPAPATVAPTITAAAPPPPPAPAPAPAPAVEPPAAAPVAAAPASVPALAAAPASAPVAEAPMAASAPVVAAAPAPVVPKPPAPKPAPAPAVEPPGFIASLMDDNPLAVVLGGGLIALLAGFGIYRYSRRSKKDSGETSFLESRLQPDSFFGASGGQRIDTRDAGGTSSSMSYSLSQLDAIGDVDPVAEADVYLAYGRDLQAEEILKEAMRANPDRMAIRTKLLEVYAKRRDIKGFELLATQVYTLTRGEGDDWAKAQEMGQKIDPENRLYQPGGAPALAEGASGQVVEPLGATTMPQSVLPSPSQYGDSVRDAATLAAAGNGVDLDLDFSSAPPTSPGSLEATQAFPTPAAPNFPSAGVDLDLPPAPPAPVSSPAPLRPASAPVEFDLSGISLDLDVPATAPGVLPAAKPDSGFSDLGLPDLGGDVDPFARKLELAEEFRQIGDMEGARDLLQEVVSKAGGTLKAKAQGMLDEIS